MATPGAIYAEDKALNDQALVEGERVLSAWQGPVRVSMPNTAPPGAPVSLAHQNGPQQLDAVFVDAAGAVNVMWVADGGVWQGPMSLTEPGSTVPGSTVALHHKDGDDQLDVLYSDRNGNVNVLWVQGTDAWSGPVTNSRDKP